MLKKTLIALGCAALLGAAFFAADQAGSACCTREREQLAAAAVEKLRCSLTGRLVETCCCVEREGRLHCTLAGRDVAPCCCTPAGVEGKEAD